MTDTPEQQITDLLLSLGFAIETWEIPSGGETARFTKALNGHVITMTTEARE